MGLSRCTGHSLSCGLPQEDTSMHHCRHKPPRCAWNTKAFVCGGREITLNCTWEAQALRDSLLVFVFSHLCPHLCNYMYMYTKEREFSSNILWQLGSISFKITALINSNSWNLVGAHLVTRDYFWLYVQKWPWWWPGAIYGCRNQTGVSCMQGKLPYPLYYLS